MTSQLPRTILVLVLALCLTSCSAETKIILEATDTASTVFKENKDAGRIERDHIASRRLGELAAGSRPLTMAELQPLKNAVEAAKADGKVTLEEADRILVEMERAAALRPAP